MMYLQAMISVHRGYTMMQEAGPSCHGVHKIYGALYLDLVSYGLIFPSWAVQYLRVLYSSLMILMIS
jgi:hypothetical protein